MELSHIEKKLVSANGNLQSIIKDHFKRNVTINILMHELKTTFIERKVIVSVADIPLYTADSIIKGKNIEKIFEFLKNDGIGQYFFLMGIKPELNLISVQKNEGLLRRKYKLENTDLIDCLIEENYLINVNKII